MSIIERERLIQVLTMKLDHIQKSPLDVAIPEIYLFMRWLRSNVLLHYFFKDMDLALAQAVQELGQAYLQCRLELRALLPKFATLDPTNTYKHRKAKSKKTSQLPKTVEEVQQGIESMFEFDAAVKFVFSEDPLLDSMQHSSLDFRARKDPMLMYLTTLRQHLMQLVNFLGENQDKRYKKGLQLLHHFGDIHLKAQHAYDEFELWRKLGSAGAYSHLSLLEDICLHRSRFGVFGTSTHHRVAIQKLVKRQEIDDYDLNLYAPSYLEAIKKLVLELQIYLSSQLSKLEVIHRFKARVAWYDKEAYRLIAETRRNNEKKRHAEDRLAEQLAKYLFDAGYPVLVKSALENNEFDLLGMDRPILVEAKITETGTPKSYLLRGLSQLYQYLNTLENTSRHVEEAFYVVFRLSGHIFEFPRVLRTGRYTIYPIWIDVSAESPSKMKNCKLVPITEADLLEHLQQAAGADPASSEEMA